MASSAERPAAGVPPAQAPAAAREGRSAHRRSRSAIARGIALAALGAACGLSTLAEGFYDLPVWGAITVGMCGFALGLVVFGIGRPRLVPALAVGGLAFLWLWSWVSVSWAESADMALEHAGRWALYAAALLTLVLLMKHHYERWLPLAFAAGGVLAVALYVVATMVFGDGQDLFFGGRLRDPLGYVNGQAGYFLLGFWPCVAVAEQVRRPLLAGAGAAGAVVLASLLVLSQSRGVVPGLALSALLVVALVPGRARRVWVLGAVGVALVAIGGPLLDVYRLDAPEGAGADPDTVARAGKAILLAAALIGVGWALAQFALGRTTERAAAAARRRFAMAEGAAAVAAVLVALVAGLIAVGDPADRVSRAYDDFVNLQVESPTDTRFLSGGGYRYDYWRVAWLEFEDEPLRGVGAGNYRLRYFTERRTNEDIRQPHSIWMQVLAELGVVGLLGLLAFVGAVVAGLWRVARRGAASVTSRAVAVAAGGAFGAWLIHTSLDWLHLLPGVTGVALCAAAALVAPWSRRVPPRPLSTARILTVVGVAVATLAAADSVGRIAAADHYRIQGRDTLDEDPIEALRLANRSLSLNDESIPAQVIRSAAYARLGDYAKARAALRDAAALEPHDPLPWMLLGDLAVRRGDIPAARRAYERALELNPTDGVLQGLADNPAGALPPEE